MNVYQAVRKMHELTEKGITFSFSFMSYSYDKNQSHGPVTVQHALLLPANRLEHNRYADYMCRYKDMDTYDEKRFWQPLLMEFNGQQVHLT